MKATIRDVGALSALKPLEVVSYLRSTGWSAGREVSSRWSQWTLEFDETETFEIAVPLTHSFRDFAARMQEVLQTLEAVEERSQPEILQDLLVTSADVVRVRLTDAELTDGSVPLEEGASFFDGAKEMMLAAACAAVERRGYFAGRRPTQAVEFMRRTRLGQTEHGSYVLTIISRVTPSLSGQNGKLFETEVPFERRVTETLAVALKAVRAAAEGAAASGRVNSFLQGVSEGISANLCDAILRMGSRSDSDRNLEVHFTWSRSRPPQLPHDVSRQVLLPSDVFPLLAEASHHLKESASRDDFEACGPVVKLERADDAQIGKATIHCFVDGQPRKVVVELPNGVYHEAVTAHDQHRIVRCTGRLVREGGVHRLLNPVNFRSDLE